MAQKTPLFTENGRPRQYQNGDFTGVPHGGTGLTSVSDDHFLLASAADTLAETQVTDLPAKDPPEDDDEFFIWDTTGAGHAKLTLAALTAYLLATIVSDSGDFTNDNAGALVPGAPVYLKSNGNVDEAQANALATARVLGLATEGIASAGSGAIQFSGKLQLTTGEWDAVTGETGGLTIGSIYYLDPSTPGMLTPNVPTTVGHEVAKVGIAIADDTMLIDITRDPIGL